MAEQQRNPNLMNPKAMQAVAGTRGAGENVLLFSEILTKVNNAKDKPKKIAVLKAKRLWHFVKGADNDLTKTQKETMFIQILEGLHQDEAKVLLGMKSKSLNKMYKGLTESVVKEAFGWNDKFLRVEPEQK